MEAAIVKLNEMNLRDAKKRADQNAVEANSSITIMIILVILGVLLSIGLGLVIARSNKQTIGITNGSSRKNCSCESMFVVNKRGMMRLAFEGCIYSKWWKTLKH